MEDLSPSAVTPAAKWEKTPSDGERRSGRHRRPPEQSPQEESGDLEQTEPHDLDELA